MMQPAMPSRNPPFRLLRRFWAKPESPYLWFARQPMGAGLKLVRKQQSPAAIGKTLSHAFESNSYFAASFRRSAQRRFIASAIALRPSGLSLRLVVFAAGFGSAALSSAAFVFLLPFGRPRPLFAGAASAAAMPPPNNTAFAFCIFNISASMCAMRSLIANTLPPMFSRHSTKKTSDFIVRALTNTYDNTEITFTYQII
jgi:hypothetical protein